MPVVKSHSFLYPITETHDPVVPSKLVSRISIVHAIKIKSISSTSTIQYIFMTHDPVLWKNFWCLLFDNQKLIILPNYCIICRLIRTDYERMIDRLFVQKSILKKIFFRHDDDVDLNCCATIIIMLTSNWQWTSHHLALHLFMSLIGLSVKRSSDKMIRWVVK